MERSVVLVQSGPSVSPPTAGPDLDLPVEPAFVSLPPRVDLEHVLEISASFLPGLMNQPGFWERRAQDRCPVEFDLEHPERVTATYPMALIDQLFGEFLNP